jgi:EAL domain-containing protein (putative c-di-GMP-specific phosphodiesterase class I)
MLLAASPGLLPTPALGFAGFTMIALTSLVQLAAPRMSWLSVEESLSGISAVLIVGMGSQRVTALSILWLTAIACGVLARGGRLHWFGRAIVLGGLLLPPARYGALDAEYAALCLAAGGLLLTSGRLTRELNELLNSARRQADSAETLLLAGDIAARMAERGPAARIADPPTGGHTARAEIASAHTALARLIEGDGVSMVVQPIVEAGSGAVHAYEALARFSAPGIDGGPLHWLALADELGTRSALERTCLGKALELFARRPPGTSLSVNLSAPVLMEPLTQSMLLEAAERQPDGLSALIVEITEETLVRGERELLDGFAPLRERGARLAVDDMGAGYSGLRQITTVLPRYLKLDRTLVSGIDRDGERAALVGALAGYSRQVDCLLVAEGVETEAELATVRALGAPYVQGFLVSRPAPPWPLQAASRTRGAARAGRARPAGAGAGIVEALSPARRSAVGV